MIYITGDTHGDLSRFKNKLSRFKNKELKKLKKGDTLIICGDFGFIWNGDKKEQKQLAWLGKQKYQILFVDGCNENYHLLEQYEVSEWNHGKVQVISGNLIHLMRGEIYEIEGKKIFAFGGGDGSDSFDKLGEYDTHGKEQPTIQETSNGIKHLEEERDTVDIIITHDAPGKIKRFMNMEDNSTSFIHNYLDTVSQIATFKLWYFGKYHKNKMIPPYYHTVFTDIVKIPDEL